MILPSSYYLAKWVSVRLFNCLKSSEVLAISLIISLLISVIQNVIFSTNSQFISLAFPTQCLQVLCGPAIVLILGGCQSVVTYETP